MSQITGRKAKKDEPPSYFSKVIECQNSNKTYHIKLSDNKSISEEFNLYFANVGPELSKKIKYNGHRNMESYMNSQIDTRFEFTPVNNSEVLEIIGSLKPKDSSGYDNVSTKLLMQLAPIIHPILTAVINQSIFTGIFPTKLKTAIVIPIYKGKNTDPHMFINYRPISLLPAISKVIEKAVHQQLYHYMSSNGLFNNSQYGFRKDHSTDYAAIELVDKVANILDKGLTPLAIFIDLSKAFDTLDHDILIKKLYFYGIRGTHLEFFKSYLSGRTQRVLYNDTLSSEQKLTTGVPQGSVLGPLLFLIYINDISNATKSFHAILFADDTSLIGTMSTFYVAEPKTKHDFAILSNSINNKLSLLNEWLQINRLSLNVDKTKYIIFRKSQRNMKKYDLLHLKLNGEPIKCTHTFNFLGLQINELLNWNDHITYLHSKISPVVGMIGRLKHLLPTHILKMIYNSLILSRFHYVNIVWGDNPGSLIKLNKKAVRLLVDAGINTHTNPIVKKLNLLTLPDIHQVKLLCFYKKLTDKKIPSYLSSMFIVNNDNMLNIPKPPCTAKFRNTLRFNLPLYLDTAPPYLIEAVINTSYVTYKNKAKKYIIDHYTSLCTKIGCLACHMR